MLIRQKTGWRLHHQAYLWPRRCRSSPSTPPSTSLQQPPRSKGPRINLGANSYSTQPLFVRRQRRGNSSGSSVELDGISTYSSRNRQGSEGSCDSSYTSSSTTSPTLSPRKRSLSSSADADDGDAQSTRSPSPSTRESITSLDHTQQEEASQVPQKRRRQSSEVVCCCDEFTSALGSRSTLPRDNTLREDFNEGDDVEARTIIRREIVSTGTKTRKDVRKRVCGTALPAVSVCSLRSCSTFKGSDNDVVDNSGSTSTTSNNNMIISHSGSTSTTSNNNMIISHSGSLHASCPCLVCIRECSCRSSLSRVTGSNREAGSAMKVAKLRNESSDAISTSIFLRSRSPSLSRSFCERSNGCSQSKCLYASSNYNLDHSQSSNSLDESSSSCNIDDSSLSSNIDDSGSLNNLDISGSVYNSDDSGVVVLPRRVQKESLVRKFSVALEPILAIEKMITLDLLPNVSQNMLLLEPTTLNENCDGIPQMENKMSSFGLDLKNGSDDFVAGQRSVSTPPSTTCKSSKIPSSSSMSASNCDHCCGTTTNNLHANARHLPSLHLSTTSTRSGCTRTETASNKTNNAVKPQLPPAVLTLSIPPSSSLSSSSATQQLFNINITNESFSVRNDDRNGSRDWDKVDNNTSSSQLSPSKSTLRHKITPDHNIQASIPQLPSHISLASISPKSEQCLPTPPSSIPTFTTSESPLPPQSSAVQCRWRGCSSELDASDLLEHIRKHVETQIESKSYACFWAECKVFNKPSWSCSWLERHIVSHSGHRPFKCILDNCGQRFHSQAVLERHVNGHFTVSGQAGTRPTRGRDEVSHQMLCKRRRQLKYRFSQSVKTNDFFDEQAMTVVKQELQCLEKHSHRGVTGNALHITFRGLIVGRRSAETGPRQSLVEFTPADILEDKWVTEEQAQEMMETSIPLSGLSNMAVSNLHNRLYRRHRFRKHRRK